MSELALAPRAHAVLSRLDSWSDRSSGRALLVKVAVTVTGPVVVLAGVAMLVLPGPGLVVIAGGLAVLALEYRWARRVLALMARSLSRARQATIPQESSRARKALGAVLVAAVAAAGFAATTAVTAFLATSTVV